MLKINSDKKQFYRYGAANVVKIFLSKYAQCDNILSLALAIVGRIMKLIDERAPDGSRNFARLPRVAPINALRDHALLLENANVVNYVEKSVAKPWFDFTFRGNRFLVHCDKSQFQLSVRDPQCPDLTLFEVGHHFERLLREKKNDIARQ